MPLLRNKQVTNKNMNLRSLFINLKEKICKNKQNYKINHKINLMNKMKELKVYKRKMKNRD